MADSKLTADTANTTPATTDILYMVDDPGGTPDTQKITFQNFLKVINGLTEDTTPALSTDFVLTYDTSAGDVKKVKPSNLTSASGLPAGWIYGLGLANNGTDATNDIDIATGKCRDSTDAADIALASALTKRLDATWAVGTNQGGLDTGSIADTTYHVWIIKRSDTGVVDVLFSTSATAPTMPTNYDYKRRIGSIVRTSAAIKAFVQDGDDFRWASPVLDVNSVNPGTSAVTRTLTVPLGIRVKALIALRGEGTSAAANPNGILISDLSVADIAPAGKFNIYIYTGLAGTTNGTGVVEVWTNTSGQVRSRLEVSAAGTTILMVTHGWMDRRGRLG